MKILMVSPEATPYAKTGGLADVAGALPHALAALGHDVRLIMPRYGHIDPETYNMRVLMPEIWVNFPGGRRQGKVWHTFHAHPADDDAGVTTYFIDCPDLFDRPGLYGENGTDYPDNADRFAFFNMAVIWTLKALGWAPDILHCNDWQSALLPVFLRAQAQFRHDRFFSSSRILFTIHNLAYQGLCDFTLLERSGLSPALFQAEKMEFWGYLNQLKGGIVFSDWVSTVSPQYAREILTADLGFGLEGFLTNRRDTLSGILNGVNAAEWNPAVDPLIARNYTAHDLVGKTECKRALEKTFRWTEKPKTPIVAMINRLDEQKGVDIFIEAFPRLAQLDARFVLLGSGRADYANALKALARKYPKSLRARVIFDNKLAHGIEAGADAFLMLSRYEPCGLSQMYSMLYGTLPIVTRTGGLADTVRHARPETIAANTATGFNLDSPSPNALLSGLQNALQIYREKPDVWRRIQIKAMTENFSWKNSAHAYEHLYHVMLGRPSRHLPDWF